MKKLLAVCFILTWAFALSMSSTSCSSTTSTPSEPDTIHLAQEGTIPVLSPAIPDTTELWLTCGCPFVLVLDGSGGDTSNFKIVDLDTMTNRVTPHHLMIRCIAPGGDSAWYAYSAVDHLGGTDRDTLRVKTGL